MHARFLLGPAGGGKTFRCLEEIRAELIRDPEGPPLLLLAPKQATFQLERQLLDNERWGERPREPKATVDDGSPVVSPHRQLHGYTRLQILSFERLAQFILTELSPVTPNWLDEEGRVMVLRALLAQKRSELKLFHATARLPGFATRLSLLLRELQRHQISPDRLLALSNKITEPPQLRDKLHDFALLLRGYLDWLTTNKLQDANQSLDVAAATLRASPKSKVQSPKSKTEDSSFFILHSSFAISALWLDGFAEMTAQELDLLAALVPFCDQATLAFCLEAEPQSEPSWLSTWSVIGQTFIRCRQRLEEVQGVQVTVETLTRNPQRSRFAQPALAHLENNWANKAIPYSLLPTPYSSLQLVSCPNPEAEAALAAREIRHFVRNGGRYREAAIIVRSLDVYADTLQRVFDRYQIPCFLDRRESVAHHPLAELTRYSLRAVAFGWRQADWFGALKTGLVPAREDEIDWLENAALEFGWDGNAWKQPLVVPDNASLTEQAERLRQRLIPPFISLAQQTAAPITGKQLAGSLRSLWAELKIEQTLEQWSTAASNQSSIANPQSPIHTTVWDQMLAWLENLELAFPSEAMSVREWLPILETGLANLTVGVIPPSLDQVSIGAIDRSRNPELKLALVLGLNEGVFPARPTEDPLLNEIERDALVIHGARLGPGKRHRTGHEWFYGYIACTRASERLVLTCAQFDSKGNKLNRSPFFDHLEKLFPNLNLENWQPPTAFSEVEHVSEIIVPAIQLEVGRVTPCVPAQTTQSGAHGVTRPTKPPSDATNELLTLPQLANVLAQARQAAHATASDQLSPAVAEALYGRELATSVSGLEDFAACPFKFFVGRGLRAEERKHFELDARERGSFQHEVLTIFHNELVAERRKWRDVSPDEARERVRRIGRNLLLTYRNQLFAADSARRFAGEMLLASLETLISVLVGWAQDYQFDPALVEAGFGLRDSTWPAWRLDVGNGHTLLLRGRIDRVDVWRDESTGASLAVVMDYKSSSRKPDRLKLYHGLQLQLPAYLAVLEQLPEVRDALNAKSLAPAGVFYVNLRGEFSSAKSRIEAIEDPALTLREGFQHFGRYDDAFLNKLDPSNKGEQFKTHSRSHDRMDSLAFRDLLNRAVENMKRFGNEIISGKIAPDPHRKGSETACDYCDYASICRFDPWTQPFRVLMKPGEKYSE